MVGEHGPRMPQLRGGPAHLLDRAAPVRPVRVQVAVAGQPPVQRFAPSRRLLRRGLHLQPLQVPGRPARQRLTDHLGRAGPDPGDALQRLRGHPPGRLSRSHRVHDGGSRTERLHPVRRGLGAFQQEGDPPQGGDRIHRRLLQERPRPLRPAAACSPSGWPQAPRTASARRLRPRSPRPPSGGRSCRSRAPASPAPRPYGTACRRRPGARCRTVRRRSSPAPRTSRSRSRPYGR